MKAPGNIGWKKYRKLMRDPARRAYYARNRTRATARSSARWAQR